MLVILSFTYKNLFNKQNQAEILAWGATQFSFKKSLLLILKSLKAIKKYQCIWIAIS